MHGPPLFLKWPADGWVREPPRFSTRREKGVEEGWALGDSRAREQRKRSREAFDGAVGAIESAGKRRRVFVGEKRERRPQRLAGRVQALISRIGATG
jgi:hypothetical protein